MTGLWVAVALLLLVACVGCLSGTSPAPGRSDVSFWCAKGGTRLMPVDTPFRVPVTRPMERWTLLVMASRDGTQDTIPDPQTGVVYPHAHMQVPLEYVILCREMLLTDR